MIASMTYIFTGLKLISNPSFLSGSRFGKLMPLIAAFVALNLVKFFDTNAMLQHLDDKAAWSIFFAEVIPGSGKRFIIIYGLLNDWPIFRPFELSRTKKDD